MTGFVLDVLADIRASQFDIAGLMVTVMSAVRVVVSTFKAEIQGIEKVLTSTMLVALLALTSTATQVGGTQPVACGGAGSPGTHDRACLAAGPACEGGSTPHLYRVAKPRRLQP